MNFSEPGRAWSFVICEQNKEVESRHLQEKVKSLQCERTA